MPLPSIPTPDAQLVGVGNYARTEWYDFFRRLLQSVGEEDSAIEEQIQDILRRLEELSDNQTTITGQLSVQVLGTPQTGYILQLRGDTPAPGADSYYGTDADGAKGYHALPSDMVPYFIASDETYTVPLYKQALFTMPIDAEGILVVDGYLIEVS